MNPIHLPSKPFPHHGPTAYDRIQFVQDHYPEFVHMYETIMEHLRLPDDGDESSTHDTEEFKVTNCIRIAFTKSCIEGFGYDLNTFDPISFFSKIQYKEDYICVRGTVFKELADDTYIGYLPISANALGNTGITIYVPRNGSITSYQSDSLSGSNFNYFIKENISNSFSGSVEERENRTFTRLLPNLSVAEVV